MSRLAIFSPQELETLNGALIDSSSLPDRTFAWYKRCADLQAEIMRYLIAGKDGGKVQ